MKTPRLDGSNDRDRVPPIPLACPAEPFRIRRQDRSSEADEDLQGRIADGKEGAIGRPSRSRCRQINDSPPKLEPRQRTIDSGFTDRQEILRGVDETPRHAAHRTPHAAARSSHADSRQGDFA